MYVWSGFVLLLYRSNTKPDFSIDTIYLPDNSLFSRDVKGPAYQFVKFRVIRFKIFMDICFVMNAISRNCLLIDVKPVLNAFRPIVDVVASSIGVDPKTFCHSSVVDALQLTLLGIE